MADESKNPLTDSERAELERLRAASNAVTANASSVADVPVTDSKFKVTVDKKEGKPQGWIDQQISKITARDFDSDKLEDDDRVYLADFAERRYVEGNRNLTASDSNKIAGILTKLGLKPRHVG